MNKCNECGESNRDNVKYCIACGYELPKLVLEDDKNEVTEIAKKSGNSKKVAFVVTVIVSFLSFYFVQNAFFSPSVNEELVKVASEINKTCPFMVDSETRLDTTVALPGKVFQYHYSLVNMEKGTVDVDALKNYVEQNIINFVRTSPEMKYQRDQKCTIEYCYRDKNRVFLFKVTVTPQQYL